MNRISYAVGTAIGYVIIAAFALLALALLVLAIRTAAAVLPW